MPGPTLLRITAAFIRLLGPAGALAADTIAVRAEAYSGALVPLTSATAFAAMTVLQGRRALGIVFCEALCVIGTTLLVATVVAATTMLPLLHTALGTWAPWAPAGYWLAGVAGVAALVLAGTVAPAALALRRPPIEAVG
jgi:hypothetical protein